MGQLGNQNCNSCNWEFGDCKWEFERYCVFSRDPGSCEFCSVEWGPDREGSWTEKERGDWVHAEKMWCDAQGENLHDVAGPGSSIFLLPSWPPALGFRKISATCPPNIFPWVKPVWWGYLINLTFCENKFPLTCWFCFSTCCSVPLSPHVMIDDLLFSWKTVQVRRILDEANGEKQMRAHYLCGRPCEEGGQGRQGLKGGGGVREQRASLKQAAASSVARLAEQGRLAEHSRSAPRGELRSSRVNLLGWRVVMRRSIFTMADEVGKNEILPQNQAFRVQYSAPLLVTISISSV